MNGSIALAGAIATAADATFQAQDDKALEIITLIGASAPLSESWSDQWEQDSLQYYIDSLNVISDPDYSAVAAADYAQYQIDQQEGENEMNEQNNLLENNKSVLQSLGNAMSQVYDLVQVPVQQQKSLCNELLILGR